MSDISVTLPDGSSRVVPAGTTPADIAAAISPGLARRRWRRSSATGWSTCRTGSTADAPVRIVTSSSPEALALYRHSTAHLLAAAVTNLFPGTQCGIGPATDEGFFYDFVVERPFVPEDLERIEKKMKELAAQDLPFERQMVPRDEARQFFAAKREPLKVQLIEEKTEGQSEVSCYTIKDRETFVDFCVGPHVPSTGKLKGFKLLSTSNAYWKGDARNQPMQRVYGTAFFSEKRAEGAPAPHRGSEEAGSPQARAKSSGCSRSTGGRLARRSGWTRGRRSTTSSRTTCARCSSPPATSS